MAQTVTGMLGWMVLSPAWIGAVPDFAERGTAALSALLRDGVAADPTLEFRCPVDVAALRPSVNLFDRSAQLAAKTEQLVEAASQLFNRHGLDGVTLDEIAASLGAAKGTFYAYVADKPALILRCYERSLALSEQFADQADRLGRTGLEKALIGLHLNIQAHCAGPYPMAQLTGIEALPEAQRRAFITRSGQIWSALWPAFNRAGLQDGSLDGTDVEALSLAGAGAFQWLQKWLDNGAERKWQIADAVVELFVKGLRRR